MGLLGKGAMVIWYDHMDEGAHDEWHSHQHLMERVGIPGFLRGRRGVSITSGALRYFVLYEVDDLGVLTSQPYLERLNNPTAWTQSVMPAFRNMNRTFCNVTASFGTGIGTHLLTIRLSPSPNREDSLRSWLISTAMPELIRQRGIATATLVEGDQAASGPQTEENKLRGKADEHSDWTLIVDGYDIEFMREACGKRLSPSELVEHGASDNQIASYYLIGHIVTDTDMQTAAEAPSGPV